MAMYDEKWKQAEAARIAKNRAGATSAASAAGDWALGRPGGMAPAKPMFAAPDYTKPNPTNAPIMAAVAAPAMGAATAPAAPATATANLPIPNFKNVRGGTATTYGSTQSPAGTQTGAGAPSAAGGAAPTRRAQMRPDGVAVVKMADGTNAYGANGRSVANAQGTMGSVNQQNFGTAVVPQAPGSIARPGVASTFGLGVNDPRLNDQIARPQVQLGANQTPGVAVRGADAMAEQYASRESREAAQKLAGDMDTDLFRLSFKAGQGGRNGRAAMDAMAAIRGKQSEIAGGLNKISADATQGRADRDNQFGISEMEQRAAERRAMLDADVTREGQQLGFQSDMAKTSADIARPDIKQDAAGNYVNLAGGVARPVLDANGKPVQGQQNAQATQRDYAREADDKLLTELIDMQADATGAIPADAIQKAQQQLQTIRGQQTQAPAGMKQVGTSGGKPVYEDAQGNRFTL